MPEIEAKRILVVDDEPDILAITRVVLMDAGYSVLVDDNGLDAVKTVYNEIPDCIVLDVMMPRMNGYQVCRLLKHDPRTREIPIILCTVKSMEMDRLYGMTAGADYYLTKPFDPGDLVKLVNDAVRGKASEKKKGDENIKGVSSTDTILTKINLLLDHKLREYTILQHVSRTIAGTLNLDDLLRIILRSTTTDLGYQRGLLLLIGDDGVIEERLSTPEDDGRTPWKGNMDEYKRLHEILERGIPRVVEEEEVVDVIPAEIIMNMTVKKAAIVPILAKGKALGAILVEANYGKNSITDDILGFFLTLAGQAGLAIENAKMYAETLKMSITDGLTNLYNHRYFMERLDAEFTRARRYDREMALLIMDVDHFKQYNDTFGHLMGDEALENIGIIMRNNIRESDIAARYGGEEFALILPETDMIEAMVSAERIRESVDDFWRGKGNMTVSIGVAGNSKDVKTAIELIRRADKALYKAKRKGRNRICQAP